MTWTAPWTFITGEAVPAETLNSMLRDNMNNQAPAQAQHAGGYFVSDGPNSVAERNFRQVSVNQGFESTTTNEWLTADGPSVSVRHGGQILVVFAARMYLEAIGGEASVAPRVDGQAGPNVHYAVRHSVTRDDLSRSMGFKLFTGLTPGRDTVRLMYHHEMGTVSFHQRQMVVMPM